MRYIPGYDGLPCVELSRRNLLALLAKLNGSPPDSACTLIDSDHNIMVKAVENAAHYSHRAPGMLHEDTQEAIES